MDMDVRFITIKEPLMFDNLRRTRVTVDTDRVKTQAAEVGAALSEASVRAGHTAEHLAVQAKDAALQAKDWAAPRVERAWQEGRKAAAPKVEQAVEQAAEKALPLVDRGYDRLVDDVLPKLISAVNAAAAAAAIGADRARDVANTRLAELAHVPPPASTKKSHTGAKVFWSIAGLAIIGAVISALRRGGPTTDPWAEEPWEESELDAPLAASDTAEDDVEEPAADAPSADAEPAKPAKPATPRRKPAAPKATEPETSAPEAPASGTDAS
jgi:hypothetical protein